MPKFLTLEEAVELVLADEADAINILPPEENQLLTDEEDFDEEDLSVADNASTDARNMPSDVCGRVDTYSKTECEQDEENRCLYESETNFSSKKRGVKRKKTEKKGVKRKKIEADNVTWKRKTDVKKFETEKVTPIMERNPDLCLLSPGEMFMRLFNDDIREMIVRESLRYAHEQCNALNFKFDEASLLDFIGIFILTGYHRLPRESMYWEKSDDVAVPLVSQRMSRARFREVKRYLHIADNKNLDMNDKIAKLRPLIELANKSLQQFGIFHENLSIDESMVPYFGHHSCKMFIQGKPIRFGYKLWSLSSSCGYPYKFDMYCGKSDSEDKRPLGTKVVEDMLCCVPNSAQHCVFFDNFFTSYELMVKLQGRSFRATGTARENRLKKCPLTDSKVMKKKERGEYEFYSDGTVLAVKWNDNRPVTVVTNYDSVEPLAHAERWKKADKKKGLVKQPKLIQNYNKHMGGVDLMDRFVAQYRPVIRSKKWYFPVFFQIINMLRVAAWLIYREVSEEKVDQLDFTRSVVRYLFSTSPAYRRSLSGPSGSRFHVKLQLEHASVASEKQGRCRYCKKNARMMCSGCQVIVHIHCMKKYHEM